MLLKIVDLGQSMPEITFHAPKTLVLNTKYNSGGKKRDERRAECGNCNFTLSQWSQKNQGFKANLSYMRP